MLISFSGPQNSGKTTLLNECKSFYGRIFNYVDEVTRIVQKQGLKINENGNDATQYAIMEAHILNSLVENNTILDRCSLDGVVYTNYLFNKGKVSRETFNFAQIVFENTIKRYDIIFYPDPNIPFDNDGIRSVDADFKNDISTIFDIYCKRPDVSSRLELIHGTVKERMERIMDILQ